MHSTGDSLFELVSTPTGARSLRAVTEGETFHPGVGPIVEAEILHVGGQRLTARAALAGPEPFVVWDVGLGAAANAIAALNALQHSPAPVELHSFERDLGAAQFALRHAEELGYVTAQRAALEQLIATGHAEVDRVQWRLHLGDFRDRAVQTAAPSPHAMLYDPYSPKANPQLWTLEHFRALHARLDPHRGCSLSSYSRSSAVRVTLLLAGFYVGPGPASGEKDQTTLAATHPDLLPCLLDLRWLERVRRSTRSAPLRDGGEGGPIEATDWAALTAHPQFQRTV